MRARVQLRGLLFVALIAMQALPGAQSAAAYNGGSSSSGGQVPTELGSLPTGPRVVVAETRGFGANLCVSPRTSGTLVRVIPDGESLELLGPGRKEGTLIWWNVRDEAGNTGWIVEHMLAPQDLARSPVGPDPMPTEAVLPSGIDRATAEGFMTGVAGDINGFWVQVFDIDQRIYSPPGVRWIQGDQTVATGCGSVATVESGPFYCPLDRTMYLPSPFFDPYWKDAKDFAMVTVVAHEWGHHIQHLLKIDRSGVYDIQTELQADCMAGMFAGYAERRGFLESGDIEEALAITNEAGDPRGYPRSYPNAHGAKEERINWFLRGFKATDFRDCKTY